MMLLASSGYLALAAVFAVSGTTKLRHPRVFAAQVANYRIVPRILRRPTAAVLALAEAGCALLLVLPPTRPVGLVVAGGLVGGFLVAMSLALARGQQIPCACFGGTGDLDMVGLPSLLRAALLGVIVVTSLSARPGAVHPGVVRPEQALVAGLMLVLVFLLAETARLLPGWFARPATRPAAGPRGEHP